MPSLLDALKHAGLVDSNAAKQIEERRLQADRERERQSDALVFARAGLDNAAVCQENRFLASAARETTQAASRVGTKAYYDRFRK